MRRVLYMAHPVSPTEAEILDRLPAQAGDVGSSAWAEVYPGDVKRTIEGATLENVERAISWLSWIRRSFLETTFIAPWIAGVQSVGSDGTPEEREAGMVDCCAVVERCDGIVLMGTRISDGMRREMEYGMASAAAAPGSLSFMLSRVFRVYDLTGYQPEGSAGRNEDHRTFEDWMRGYQRSQTR